MLQNQNKRTIFAKMIELERHIKLLLLDNDCVIVPGFGGFMTHYVEAKFEETEHVFHPPYRETSFNPQLKLDDSLLVQSYIETYDLSYPEAFKKIEGEVGELNQIINSRGIFKMPDIGTLSLNKAGIIEFAPWSPDILTPQLYGLDLINILPLQDLQTAVQEPVLAEENPSAGSQDEDSSKKTQPASAEEIENDEHKFISIRVSYLRNTIAACIAIIAFFAFPSALEKSSNLKTSYVDTNLLNELVPTMEKRAEAKTVSVAPKQQRKAPAAEAEKQTGEKAEAKPFFTIVLASMVSKRNAENFVDLLHGKGFDKARVQGTGNSRKVIYGEFDSEAKARGLLNQLHHNKEFAEGWITKIKNR